MMQVYFHLENTHERKDELNRKLELARLRAESRARPRPKGQPLHALTVPFRRTTHLARLLAVRAKCAVPGGA
jgi:hypothetical protein